MPNRILKESICTSDTIAQLDFAEEVFFYRILVQCDDFGRMDARPYILRAKCFAAQLDRVSDENVSMWLDKLCKVGLIWIYHVDGKPYLQVTNWDRHQQKRARHSKYPDPPEEILTSLAITHADDIHPPSSDEHMPSSGEHMQSSDITCNQVMSDDCICPRESRIENRESRIIAHLLTQVSAPEVRRAPPDSPIATALDASDELSQQSHRRPSRARARAPAVIAFREVTGRWPNRAQESAITQAISDVEMWRKCVSEWCMRGYKPTNVAGMLDWYHAGGPPQGPGPGRGGANDNKDGAKSHQEHLDGIKRKQYENILRRTARQDQQDP
jgi:hypothetical protein